MSFYRIKDLSPALDGLTVEGETSEHDPRFVNITRIVNTNVMVGDRTLSFPVSQYGLVIRETCLVAVDDPQIREFTHTAPWGKCLFEGNYRQGNLEVAYAKYEQATQVTLTEKNGETSRTVYTDYIPVEVMSFDHVREVIEHNLLRGGDVDDLVFELKRLKEKH